ncbi:family 10 glycosylhydrolase, partial [Candidatus Sumerlaeota bacterium]|nr:family 10 glycosylhydrolase [Candidatus Sumerlaeota bacterium]
MSVKQAVGLKSALCLLLSLMVCSAALADGYPVLLLQEGVPVQIERQEVAPTITRGPVRGPDSDLSARLTRIVQSQIAGPSDEESVAGLQGLFPDGCTLDSVEVDRGQARVCLTVTEEFVTDVLDELIFEQMVSLTVDWGNHLQGLRSLSLQARLPGESAYFPLQELLPPPPPVEEKPVEEFDELSVLEIEPITPRTSAAGQSPVRGQPQPSGALSGASVFLSPGHGWYHSSTLGRWATQRGNTNNIIEDLSNGEAVLQNLTHYLWNAGARVYTCRERDLQTNMVIVDNGGAGHSETGTWTTQVPSGGYYGANVREAVTVTGSPTATSTFTPTIPEDGFYAVYVHQRGATSGTTTTDARYTVNHSGGSTTWIQNQVRDGWTWKYIGTYHFMEGTSGSVVIDNQSATAGRHVVADAVRFGGGMGDYADGGSVSGWPRWEESGKYFAGFMGHSYSNGTVTAMPLYADWECEDSWEGGSNHNAIYVSWHTNAPDPGTGTSSFAYSSSGWGGAFTGVAGGLELRNAIHNELINDIRAGWDSNWTNRGATTANFGEINPSNNNDMPASLHEIAFHDTAADAEDIEDPNFRRLAARAMYQGIVKFYHDHFYLVQGNSEFNDDTLLPEPPTNLRVTASGAGSVTVAWDAPPSNTGDGLLGDPATGYRVYQSSNGRGFDNGSGVTGTSTTISGLTAGEVVYIRVSATNSGGESFPTETLAVSLPSAGSTPVLIVNGFDRIDRMMNVIEDDPHDTDDLHRGYLWLMNTYDYVIPHAEAIAAHGTAFDSCANEAVINGQISLGNYDVVVWILGEESVTDHTFDSTEQSAVTSFLSGGGRLFVSGSEIGWDLEAQGNGVSFYNSTLYTDYVADDAGVYSATGSAGTIFAGISLGFDDGTEIYDVNYPDTLAGINGSVVCMTYDVAGSPGAAIQWPTGSTGGQIVMLGFPFETITSATARNQVMAAALEFFDAGSDTTPPAAPTGLAATGGDGQVSLEWNDNGESDLAGYNVYRSTTSGSGHTQINGSLVTSSNYVDSTVTNGTTYYYVVTAVDTSTNESGNSAEASATPTAGATEVIVDNDDGSPAYTETGTWTTSGSTGYNGGTYRFATAGAAATATWNATLSAAGNCEVFVFYRAGTNRATSTRYEIATSSGTQVATVDQTQNSMTWVSLGVYTFDAGATSITLDAAGSTGGSVVIADTVKFTPSGEPPLDPAEMRIAIITVFDDVNDTASIQNWVDEIAGLNCNAIAVHARYRGDATYFPNKTDSTYPNSEPRSSSAGSIDVLEEFTTRGHAAGLMVLAYVNTQLVTDGSDTHPSPYHIVNTHPEWITYHYNGGSPIVQTIAHEAEGRWIDPGIPAARQYVSNICGDIMMNYDCDGIILDRIRYPQTNWSRTTDFGYHPTAVAAFNTQFGKSGIPSPSDPDWILFRQQQITAQVQEVYSVITAIDPDHILLAYPIGRFSDAINYNYQDWPTWLSSGVIDGVLPQIYTSDNATFSSRCDEHIAAYSGSRLLGVTTLAYLSGVDVDGQIEITRTKGLDGTSPFRHGSMEALGYFTDLANAYVNTAPWPDMPWKTSDTVPPAAPTGLAATAGYGQVSLGWNDNTEQDLDGYNVYRSTTSGSGYTQINGSLVTSSDYTDNSVTNFTTYYYVVTAVDDTPNANESGNSAEASATPEDTTPPAAPTGLAATGGDGQVSLDWNDNGESD